ncbi:MAG TPA: SURF1 family protein, partial [Xanthobacteraceae bacterium]|nr:SURF1 family protein [Xanthobacteraceae bacterium]
IVSAVAFAILIGLGVWQLDRKAWKEGLIADMNARLAAAPEDLPPPAVWPSLSPGNAEFRRVKLRADFLDVPDTYAYIAGSAVRDDIKSPGYFVFRPARLPDGRVVVVNRGYVPIDHTAQSVPGPLDITGYLRWPEPKSMFVSSSDGGGDTWFVRDHLAMARARGWGEVAPFYIDQEAPVPPSGLPRPARLAVLLRNDHLGYALTWFGLAAVLAGVFGAWVVSRSRSKPA